MYDFLLIASCLVFAATCLAYSRHQAASLLHPATIYLAFHGFIFVIRPLFARFYDFDLVYRVYDFQPSMSDKITVILGANLAMLVFTFVSVRVASQRVAPIPRDEFDRYRGILAGPIMLAAIILGPLAIAAQIANWARRVDPYQTMSRDAATGILVNIESNGWFSDSALMLAPLAVLAVWLFRYRFPGWMVFGAASILMLGSGGRGSFIFAAAAVTFIYMLERHRTWFDGRIMLLAAVSLVSFNAVVEDRGAAVRGLLGAGSDDTYTSSYELDPLEHMDFANLEYFEFVVYAVPQRTGSWDYFAHNLQIFTEPVPRALWKDKPIGSPVQFFQLWDYGTPIGMTISLPGAGWMSFGYLGIVIQAAAFALLYGLLYTRLLVNRPGAVASLIYALGIATSVTVLRDGILLTLLRQLPFYLGPLILALAFARFGAEPRRAHIRATMPEQPADTPAARRKALAARAPQ